MRKDIITNKNSEKIELHCLKKTQLSDLQHKCLIELLTDEEIDRVNGFRTQEMQQHALWVRASLRELLSEYSQRHQIAEVKPVQWQFEKLKYGKPYIINQPSRSQNIEFNLSHSGDWLLIGITHRKADNQSFYFGVDIERERSNTNVMTIAKRYFSELELEQLEALETEQEKRQRFFDLWTCKESFIKATGKGLATDLKSFSFDFSKVIKGESFFEVPLMLRKNVTGKCGTWFSAFGRLDDVYRFALSVKPNFDSCSS
ncbi:4'-phosphopantetheinyl transferase family protein [Parashewanella tropica]|uniref:4'-phosphopantetheinyl transferase family protein n=1 Tax=Parashewanella tropica TaxID=2547970 RepID=UPI00105A3703|nr:4'-phosphopantetheinyl transferase superfamily protein [Parashewanella tropica]